MAGWTTVKVPREIHSQLKQMAEKRGVSMWELIADMLSFYRAKMSEGMGNRTGEVEIDAQKAAYYIMKLSYSVTKFKEQPDRNNYEWLLKTIEQIESRLGVDLGELKKAAELYKRVQDKQSTYTLNMAWKSAIMSIMSLVC